VTFKEYALQDANTLEATQSMLGSGAVTEVNLLMGGRGETPVLSSI
jgi:hypothetical protein